MFKKNNYFYLFKKNRFQNIFKIYLRTDIFYQYIFYQYIFLQIYLEKYCILEKYIHTKYILARKMYFCHMRYVGNHAKTTY